MIALFTDFFSGSPYVGQMLAVIAREAPGEPTVELCSSAPTFQPLAAGVLLERLGEPFPQGSIFLAVVDPGVGSLARRPVVVECDGNWYVGPENGLFDAVIRNSMRHRCWEITWRPERLSHSFHGRDLFAPVAASIARGDNIDALGGESEYRFCAEALADQVIYVDGYGNLITSLRCDTLKEDSRLLLGERVIERHRTFSSVPTGEPLCYCNAFGLMEVAVNQGSAMDYFTATLGTPVAYC